MQRAFTMMDEMSSPFLHIQTYLVRNDGTFEAEQHYETESVPKIDFWRDEPGGSYRQIITVARAEWTARGSLKITVRLVAVPFFERN